MAHEVNYDIGPQGDRVPPPIDDLQLGPGLGLQGQDLGGQVQVDRHIQEEVPPGHLFPNVSTSVRIFGPAEVRHTTMGTLSGL